MARKEFEIPNMLGDIDADVIVNELRQIVGVEHVELLRHAKHGVIEWNAPASWDEIQRRMMQLGYRIE